MHILFYVSCIDFRRGCAKKNNTNIEFYNARKTVIRTYSFYRALHASPKTIRNSHFKCCLPVQSNLRTYIINK